MKTTFITTVFNEEKTIEKLLKSLSVQTQKIDECIIADAGSRDNTVGLIRNYISKQKDKKRFKVIIKKGNRSVGRNTAIKEATGDIILVSDAGCILDRNWVKYITFPFKDKNINIVAGYYKGFPKNIFQKCLIPFVLIMTDKVNPQTFLPASRSMAFTKLFWEKIGSFPEAYSHNEDYVFAKQLQRINATIFFEKKAIVYWIPRKNIKEAFYMFYRFAYGDAEAKIFRPKVLILFLRYIIGLTIFFLCLHYPQYTSILVLFISMYISWSTAKNYQYVKHYQGLFWLPVLQLTADVAVMSGTTMGFLSKFPYSRV